LAKLLLGNPPFSKRDLGALEKRTIVLDYAYMNNISSRKKCQGEIDFLLFLSNLFHIDYGRIWTKWSHSE